MNVAELVSGLPPLVCRPNVAVQEAAFGYDRSLDWLNATGYRHLPVMDAGRLVGIVSMKDLLWAPGEQFSKNKGGMSHAG